jgi:peroxiredoxin
MDYNYERYRMSNYDLSRFDGPKAGEDLIDFKLTALDGRDVSLSDYKGKWLVLETGSLTCPMFVKNIDPLRDVKAKYPDVEFLVIYVREAHPGARRGPSGDIAEKIALAKEMKDSFGEHREILVDNVDGAMHQAYGSMPNMVYIVNPEGKVIYRCDWSFAKRIDQVLADRDTLHTEEHVRIVGAAPWITVPVCLKGGWDALWDLAKAMPFIAWAHLKQDVGMLFGKKFVHPADQAKTDKPG